MMYEEEMGTKRKLKKGSGDEIIQKINTVYTKSN